MEEEVATEILGEDYLKENFEEAALASGVRAVVEISDSITRPGT